MSKKSVLVALLLTIFAGNTYANPQVAPASSKSEIQKLNIAAQNGDQEVFKKLLSAKNINDQDHDGFTPLMSAALGGNESMVKTLIAKKADLELKNKVGDTALAVALTNDQYAIARQLIQAGAKTDILVAGEEQDTLLMRSAANDFATTKMILDKNPKLLNLTNKNGETALMQDRKSTRLNSSHTDISRMPSSA